MAILKLAMCLFISNISFIYIKLTIISIVLSHTYKGLPASI